MPKVEFLSTTLTSKGRFEAGESKDFTVGEAEDLQRLSSVKSPEPIVDEDAEEVKAEPESKKSKKKKAVEDESKDRSEK